MPVCSIVIYLVKDGNAVIPPYVQELPDGTVNHTFMYRYCKLWELPSKLLLQNGMEGMLPLLPLTQDGTKRETIDLMIAELQRINENELNSLGYSIASLVFQKASDRQWLRERMKPMLGRIEDSWIFEEVKERAIAKGLAKGLEQGLEQGRELGLEQGRELGRLEALQDLLMHFLRLRFSPLSAWAEPKIAAVTQPETLQTCADALFGVQTLEEAQQVLLELDKKPTSDRA
ncbi:hypothetical protein [Tengunoibacter tsumagoiensis]|uniref:Transposase (putative) YhgA-like domain-containing protein n=1 Tax=Tengunoibacter tsumagoiensis TaxID=2014871 RepID=A0A401ZUP4_9CHLR|nr:hypothetical protein [Tengunoibacter tsumagoiensis]GCE10645.1 hypothetical protein KTT_05040 [Tengunoibacter tsumagoiensis]